MRFFFSLCRGLLPRGAPQALSDYGDVLLAYEMNGRPLPRDHGYPLRAVVPGHVGVRNVKWVTEVAVSTEEAVGPWQRGIAYKGFSPMVKSFEGIDVERILSMQVRPFPPRGLLGLGAQRNWSSSPPPLLPCPLFCFPWRNQVRPPLALPE